LGFRPGAVDRVLLLAEATGSDDLGKPGPLALRFILGITPVQALLPRIFGEDIEVAGRA